MSEFERTGYNFQGVSPKESIRQFINLDDVYNQQGGLTGVNAKINVAQDDKEWDELQSDTRLNATVYDDDLAELTSGKRGVDETTALTREQWDTLVSTGEMVEGESYQYLDRDSGRILTNTPSYLAYESTVIQTHNGIIPNTDTAKAMVVPLDIARHGENTANKMNENSPGVQARMALQGRVVKRDSNEKQLDDVDLEL